MKILLIGEFSSMHKNLQDGLIALGHRVDLASSGDGWKSIDRDIDLGASGSIIIRGIKRLYKRYMLLKLVKQYDLIQLINPFEIYSKFIPNKLYFKILIQNSKKFVLLAAGSDAYFWKYGRHKLRYGPFDDILKYDLKKRRSYLESRRAFSINKYIADNCDGIIPILYEYQKSYEGHPSLLNLIPIPMNVDKIVYKENKVNDKITVFHGINRYGFKGTKYVEAAFEILSNKYPQELNLIIDGKMPLKKYLEFMQQANVVIDQTSSYSLGVNGIYALAMGKIVCGGAETEALNALDVTASPIINIKPNTQSIVEAVEKIIEDKKLIPKIGLESRNFVEYVHDYKKVAEKYITTWKIIKQR